MADMVYELNTQAEMEAIICYLMKTPTLLAQTDKYKLSKEDFKDQFCNTCFKAIYRLFETGSSSITPQDIENVIKGSPKSEQIFIQNNGLSVLSDWTLIDSADSFDWYYNELKRKNLLTELQNSGYSISEIISLDKTDSKYADKLEDYKDLSPKEIIDRLKRNLIKIEARYTQDEVSQVSTAYEGIEDIIEGAEEGADIGLPIQGDLISNIVNGAKRGTFFLRSGGSGTGKSRQSVGDACYLAFPLRYEPSKHQWVETGNCEKVLFIATEQQKKEIQKMILAYLTGFNESKFRFGKFTESEQKVIQQAISIMHALKDNFFIVQMPNPTIELVKTIVRENCLMHNITCVFYDYIFVCPSLINEFKGVSLRNDEILLMFSTALKDLAVELNIFMSSSTQLNSKGDDNKDIKNESAIAGSRAIINKADVGIISSRPTQEELEYFSKQGIQPNLVCDVYKVRSGSMTQVRVWSFFDYGTLRKTDICITDSRMEIIPPNYYNVEIYSEGLDEVVAQLLEIIGVPND